MTAPTLRFGEFEGDWANKKIEDDAITVTSGSRDWAQYYSESGDKFIRMTNLVRDGITLDLSDLKYVQLPMDSKEGKRTSLKEGDILISITAELGKLGLIHKDLGIAYINQHTALVRMKNNVDSKFYAYALSTEKYNNKLNSLNDSGAKSGLNLGTIRDFELITPSKEEQTKIASFLSAVDEKISQLTQKHELLSQYKQGMMQKLFSQQIRFKADDGGEFGEWEEVFLGNIAKPQQWKTISSNQLTKMGYPVFGANGYIGFYTEYNHENETIAVTCRGATCGEVTLVQPKSYITGNSMAIDELDLTRNSTIFIYYALRFRGFKDVISGSAQPQIVGNAIKKIDFLCPYLEEQTKIANFLSAIDQKIEVVAQQIQQTKLWKKGLLQQMFV